MSLPSPLDALWDAYLENESRGLRGPALGSLDQFLDELQCRPKEEWRDWALAVAARVVDDGDPLPVRMPLFRRALFPTLLAGFQNRHPGCARWLAGMAQLLYSDQDCRHQLPADARTEIGLLWTAVRLDENDHLAADRLLEAHVKDFRYVLHELPAGVLFDSNGATPEQCLQLLTELEQFEQLAEQRQQSERFRPFVARCRFHFEHYRRYQLQGESFPSYAEYLEQHDEPATDNPNPPGT